MKYVDEYRDAASVRQMAEALHTITTKKWTIMEVCGGQTHSIMKFGLHRLLPDKIRLIHGPGCPVCVTPIDRIDHAIEIALTQGTILCSFGDMLRVPGTVTDLMTAKAKGADVRVIYSPLQIFDIAAKHPEKEVVLFAVGFETTAPAIAMAIWMAKKRSLKNLSFLVSHVLVPPALDFLLSSPGQQIQGFLAAGHVCTVMGSHEYGPIAKKYQVPIVITGFEPLDILQGVYLCVQELETGECRVVNQYERSVKKEGNLPAQHLLEKVFICEDRSWRGMGTIPDSGLGLHSDFSVYDAEHRFPKIVKRTHEDNGCISGLIMQGKKSPHECPLFGGACTPECPKGAPMVSSEGACAAYYQYTRKKR